jgi:hypothetical protein
MLVEIISSKQLTKIAFFETFAFGSSKMGFTQIGGKLNRFWLD